MQPTETDIHFYYKHQSSKRSNEENVNSNGSVKKMARMCLWGGTLLFHLDFVIDMHFYGKQFLTHTET